MADNTKKKSIWGVLADVLGDGNAPRTPRSQPRGSVGGRPKPKKPCGGCGSR